MEKTNDSIREKVLQFVTEHSDGCLIEEISNGLGITVKQTNYAINHLTEIGCVISDRKARYPKKTVFATGQPIIRKTPYRPPTRNRKSPNAEEVCQYVSEHPNATVSQICANTRFCESVVRLALRRLEKEGRVERDTIDFNACRGMEQKWRCL